MVSLLSWYIIQLNNPPVVDDYPIENIEVVDASTSKPIKAVTVSKSEKIDSGVQENENLNIDIENNSGYLTEEIPDEYEEIADEYEEIIFQDNFDKEYRSGTEDNYLED